MRYVLGYLSPYKKRMALGLSIKITSTVIELFIPYILSHILKSVVTKESVLSIVMWGGIMILCAAWPLGGRTVAAKKGKWK